MRNWTLTLAVMILAGGSVVPARADIQFLAGNNPQPDEQNVLFNGATDIGGPATTVTGHLNGTGNSVSFTSTSFLTTPAIGQARIEACTSTDLASCNTSQNPVTFTDLMVSLTEPPGGVFTDFIFNLDASMDGSLTVTDTEGNGTIQTSSLLGLNQSGQNFYTVVAINGQDIRSVSLSSTAGLTDANQLRVSGVAGLVAVPEPGSIVLLGSVMSILGFGIRRMRRV